jgi:hypothetical protein
MKKEKFFALVVILLVVSISACATQGVNTKDYIPPQPFKASNEIVVEKPYGEIWDKLVKEIAKSFFVINNIEKESRIINVSYSTNSPGDYIDCGKSHRTYSQGDKKEVFDYQTAESSVFKLATPQQPNKAFAYYWSVRRETSLEGRANIYVSPPESDKGKTTVTVNTRYILTIKIKSDTLAEHVRGAIRSLGRGPEDTITIMFNTNQPGEHVGQYETIRCFCKGRLEDEILRMVR